jgi:hypothetical protein
VASLERADAGGGEVLFPHRSLADYFLLAETETWVIVAAKNHACCSKLRISKSVMKMLRPRDLPQMWIPHRVPDVGRTASLSRSREELLEF